MQAEDRFERLSDEAFAHLGVQNVAYVKAVEIDGRVYFMLTSAAGQDILVSDSRAAATLAAEERGLIVLTMH
ncbi:MAG: hypothetical protein O3B08_01415 [Proteobacteria bacterium]|nr:hypothetical protein [Pseudomonadota bacterium]